MDMPRSWTLLEILCILMHSLVCSRPIQSVSNMLFFLLMEAHSRQWIMIAVSLFVYPVTAVDEYCIEKPWDCCDGDSSVKPGNIFLTTARIWLDLKKQWTKFSLFLTEMRPRFELKLFSLKTLVSVMPYVLGGRNYADSLIMLIHLLSRQLWLWTLNNCR